MISGPAFTIPQAGCPCIDDLVFPGFSNGNDELLPIAQSGKEPSWHVYPNPAVDVIQVVNEVPDAVSFDLQIVDISGQVIRQFRGIPGGELERSFDISNLSPGIYLLAIGYNGLVQSKRFIKR